MVGIVLALVAALIVICIVFGCSERTQTSRDSARDLSFLDRTHRKKS
jgi:hypothetical protein